MRLTDASVAIRPRRVWEAMDLGILLARRHAGLLMASWALVTLPVFALITLLLWRHPTLAALLFWWLKPAWERLPLYILSHALFGDTPSLKQALRALPGLLKPQLLASLTWRRLSPTRSFDLPVLQLEGLKGDARSKRLIVLGQRYAGGASWLTVLGMHLEGLFWLGLVGLIYLMLPQQIELNMNWQRLIDPEAADWLWLEHLSNLLYALVLVFTEPLYVACGFTLYLNRRTALEAWDIELAFRRLRQRLTGSAYALLLAFGLFTLAPAPDAVAADSVGTCPLPIEDPLGPDAARLQQQPLTSQASHEAINKLLAEPPFENRETVTLWRFGDQQKAAEQPAPGDAKDLAELLKTLLQLGKYWQSLDVLALAFEVLLWGALICLLVLLLWRYREWLHTFASRLGLPQRAVREMPSQLFGLELAPESLPDDIAGAAERLWNEQPREALGLLYRGLLSRLLHDFRLPLKNSHTEGEVLQLVQRLQQEELNRFSTVLTRHWQNLAYGHQLPPEQLRRGLCEGWRRLFPSGAPA
ncbi:DUF4129 domain-containing protein [Pseudomonas alcaligenes]|uniref:DUF4129 domain-containing protein n=1 Tax=Aquipseudomonas alcaligenes TaxID=43263 RepID=A0ABR7S303_AQUAC|nr:DUF4129 domain-containing protein [Pseudomonas alcaligenes]MBC9251858.1 DUF4129 domain-containing protein [Pseudomonas alcaligenes]